jgi:hypothetical protein
MSIFSSTQGTYPYPNEPTWPRKEKSIARAAFDGALGRELHELIQETKRMTSDQPVLRPVGPRTPSNATPQGD